MIRVLLADDQQLIRAGLRLLLDAEDDVAVVGEADDGRAAVARRYGRWSTPSLATPTTTKTSNVAPAA